MDLSTIDSSAIVVTNANIFLGVPDAVSCLDDIRATDVIDDSMRERFSGFYKAAMMRQVITEVLGQLALERAPHTTPEWEARIAYIQDQVVSDPTLMDRLEQVFDAYFTILKETPLANRSATVLTLGYNAEATPGVNLLLGDMKRRVAEIELPSELALPGGDVEAWVAADPLRFNNIPDAAACLTLMRTVQDLDGAQRDQLRAFYQKVLVRSIAIKVIQSADPAQPVTEDRISTVSGAMVADAAAMATAEAFTQECVDELARLSLKQRQACTSSGGLNVEQLSTFGAAAGALGFVALQSIAVST